MRKSSVRADREAVRLVVRESFRSWPSALARLFGERHHAWSAQGELTLETLGLDPAFGHKDKHPLFRDAENLGGVGDGTYFG